MSKRETAIRHRLIMRKIKKYPATFNEIADYLEFESELQGYNFNIGKRTFQRDLDDIRSIHNTDIQYDFSRKVYFIDNEEQSEVNERILEAFDTFNALNISDRLSNHIHFEKRRPQGTDNLYGLLHAIKNQVQIKFTYQKYWEDELTQRQVEPYALKEFKNRWYVLAKDLNDKKVKSFALDRLTALEITKMKFQLPINFDVNEHFKYSFGIISPNEDEPQEVILSFTPFQGKYIKSLPLHESQQVLVDNNVEFRLKLMLYITHDFIMELLSYGANLKVIQPDSLIDELKLSCQNTIKRYQ